MWWLVSPHHMQGRSSGLLLMSAQHLAAPVQTVLMLVVARDLSRQHIYVMGPELPLTAWVARHPSIESSTSLKALSCLVLSLR